MNPRVLLIDDHALVRSGIRALLDNSRKVTVVGEFSSGREALEMCGRLKPDIVLTDVEMPLLNGIELTRQICSEHPEISVIMVTMHSSQQYVLESVRAGAMGYVLKDSAIAELLTAIRSVEEGKRYLSPGLVDLVLSDYAKHATGTQPVNELDKLSGREREVLQLLSEGCTSAHASEALHISVRTVDAHRSNMMQKLNIHSIAGLTKFAIAHGLTSMHYKSDRRDPEAR